MTAKQIVNRLLEDYDPDLAEVSPEEVAAHTSDLLSWVTPDENGDTKVDIEVDTNANVYVGNLRVNVSKTDDDIDLSDEEVEKVNEDLYDWCKTFFDEVETMAHNMGVVVEDYLNSDEYIIEDFANLDQHFDEDGELDVDGDFTYDQLDEKAKRNAIRNHDGSNIDWDMELESTDHEIKWVLAEIGFQVDKEGIVYGFSREPAYIRGHVVDPVRFIGYVTSHSGNHDQALTQMIHDDYPGM